MHMREAFGSFVAAGWAALSFACSATGAAALPPPKNLPPDPAAHWASPPPPATSQPELPRLPISRVALENGLSVSVVHLPESKTATVRLWVPKAGGHPLGPVSAMVAGLSAGTLFRGQVAVRPRLSGQAIGSGTEPNGSTLTWRVLGRGVSTALPLLAAYATAPVFDEQETLNLLRGILGQLESYSRGRAYLRDVGRAALPTIEVKHPKDLAAAITDLSPATLAEIHRCTMSPEGAELVVAGPQPVETVTAWARKAFGTWENRSGSPGCEKWGYRSVDASEPLDRPQLYIAHVGSKQPDILTILPAPPLGHPDRSAYWLAAQAITDNSQGVAASLRHAGATYGIHAHFNNAYPEQSLFEMTGAIDAEHATEGVKGLLENLVSFADRVDDAGIARAKRRSLTTHLQARRSDAGIASLVMWMRRKGRDAADVGDLEMEVQSTSPDACREAARRWTLNVQPVLLASGLNTVAFRRLKLNANIVDYSRLDP